MRLTSDIFERLPQAWVLVGLLIITSGLYLGFEYSIVFVYLGIGMISLVYGLALSILLRLEGPRKSNPRPLSKDFISAGATVIMPASKVEQEPSAS